MNRIFYVALLSILFNTLCGQVNSGAREFFYSQLFCNPQPPLDKVSTTNLSLAYSFRKLRETYTGNCIRIRRASDNTEIDIPFTCLNFADTILIKSFLSGTTGFVTKWYDQSGFARDATMPTTTSQPQISLTASNNKIGIMFDGANDYLKIATSMQILTNNGLEGSLFLVMKATTANQSNFGVLNGADRWSMHGNWSNNELYFDPGICCNTVRSFTNTAGLADFYQYSLIRGTNYGLTSREGILGYNTPYSSTTPTTSTDGPSIGAAFSTGGPVMLSNSMFQELIMFKLDITGTDKTTLETDQMNFW